MDKFFTQVQQKANLSATSTTEGQDEASKKRLPKGVVLGKDGKPCRSCTSVAAWTQMIKDQQRSKTSASNTGQANWPAKQAHTSMEDLVPDTPKLGPCPADVETLGRSSWTLLHTISASYPEQATTSQQRDMRSFISLFSKLYPCWHCAEDFRDWIARPGNEPKLEGRELFGRWMCQAHNEVNEKLGKKAFDCTLWKERWLDGPKDGNCN